MIYKLNEAIYDLKYILLIGIIQSLTTSLKKKFKLLNSKSRVFMNKKKILILIIYINGLIIKNNKTEMMDLMKELGKEFILK